MSLTKTSHGPALAAKDRRTNTLPTMRLWRTVAPDIAYTSPATYSCLVGELSSKRKYSSTVIVGSADASRMPHATLGDAGRATEQSPSEAFSCVYDLTSTRSASHDSPCLTNAPNIIS